MLLVMLWRLAVCSAFSFLTILHVSGPLHVILVGCFSTNKEV